MKITQSGTQSPVSIAVEGRVLKADGTVVELGTLAYTHRNWLRRVLGQRHVRGSSVLRGLLGRAPKITDHQEG